MSVRLAIWIGLGAALAAFLLVRPLGVAVAVLALATVGGLTLARRASRGDLAFEILSLASRTLPDERAAWGEAMIAELDQLTGRWPRLRFALGCARAALLLPPRPGAATQAVRIVAATSLAAITGLFLYTRYRLLGATYPGPNSQRGVLGIEVDLLFLTVAAVFAMTALVRCRPTERRVRTARLYGATAGVVVGGLALTASLPGLAVQDVNGLAANNWILLAALAATLAAGLAAARSSHNPRAGKEAGWWAGSIGGAILFIGLTTLSYTNTTWFTHDPASIHAFDSYAPPATHFKTITAQILASNLENAAMIGILVLPILGFVLGALGGALGGATNKIHHHTTNQAAANRAP